MLDISYTYLHPHATPPARATSGAAGYDLCAALDAPLCIAPGERVLVPTGLAIALPDAQVAALLFARSGLAMKQGLSLVNGVGVIDSDYRGELCVAMINLSEEPQQIQHGDRVAQLCLMPVYAAQFCRCETLSETHRGTGGFGSTGK